MRAPGSTFRIVAIAALGAVLICPGVGRAYTPEQEQACTGDAFRLCSSEIPDIDRITACMITNKAQLSPGCRALFGPAPEASRAAGKPLNIKAGSSGTSVSAKSRKAKRPAKPRAMTIAGPESEVR